MKKQKLTKEQFRSLLREMIIVELSGDIEKNPHSFSGWFKRNAKKIWDTNGDLHKLLSVLTTALKSKDLQISDDKFEEIQKILKQKPNDYKRLNYMKDLWLKPSLGVGDLRTRRYR